jgi:hypothetical protein
MLSGSTRIRSGFLTLALLLAGCATSTIETRRQEKATSYQSLTPDEKQAVDGGQIRVGMTSDAVYISWGKPSEILESEDQNGHFVIWRYYGTAMYETRYWAYRPIPSGRTDLYLERYLTSEYNPETYVRAEIVFSQGRVVSWRTLPRPPG